MVVSALPQIVDFGSWQGPSIFKTAGIAHYYRKNVNGSAIILKMRERRQGPKDAFPDGP